MSGYGFTGAGGDDAQIEEKLGLATGTAPRSASVESAAATPFWCRGAAVPSTHLLGHAGPRRRRPFRRILTE